ncbi:MAG: ABC transporter ATP-binding protein [Actinomycetaceae bacterium]|nr:ABC transporter ATP-binding protein [Actinomycetaceae bacterium]
MPVPTPDATQGIQFAGLLKRFGNLVAVNSLNLNVPRGSFYGFVGPNGAGKTTALTMGTGLLTPDQGTAYILGHDMWAGGEETRKAKQSLGVLPDGMHVFERLTGLQHISFSGQLRGIDPKTATERGRELLTALDLADAAHKQVGDYSAGMRKKVLLAGALVHAPQVLVLDEPFEAVDPISAANIQSILRSFVEGGGTVILSSHVMATVQKLCTHVAVIHHGHVLVAGTIEEVAAGTDLDTRFAQLVGGVTHTEGLQWLQHSSD